MHETQGRTAPIDYVRYRVEAARLRSEAIAGAFRRLGRLLAGRGRGRRADRVYDELSAAGCGQ